MKKDLLDLMKKHSKEVRTFEQGEVVEGTIVGVDKKYILLDVGAKQEGLLFKDELKNMPDFTVEIGKTLSALVLYPEDVKGNLVLSLKLNHNTAGILYKKLSKRMSLLKQLLSII